MKTAIVTGVSGQDGFDCCGKHFTTFQGLSVHFSRKRCSGLEEFKAWLLAKEIKMKTAVITGISGQDGSYLAEHLLAKGYTVVGIDRRKSTRVGLGENTTLFADHPSFISCFGDIKDASFINWIVQEYKPEKYFNLAAQSHVGQSFKEPLETFDTDARAVIVVLDSIRRNSPETRFYQASTSELFGGLDCPSTGYTEDSPLYPRSPYGVAKLAAYWAVKNYREAYGLFACNGILFNHESPRRGSDFVTRKITLGISAIAQGKAETISLGNIDARRDWGFAGDYVQAMDLMLDADEPDEFIVATGKSISVRDFLRSAIRSAGLDDSAWEKYVDYDPRFMRPSEVPNLLGNPTKINQVLGWEATHTVDDLVKMMIETDLV